MDKGEKGEDWEHEDERADDDLEQGDDEGSDQEDAADGAKRCGISLVPQQLIPTSDSFSCTESGIRMIEIIDTPSCNLKPVKQDHQPLPKFPCSLCFPRH